MARYNLLTDDERHRLFDIPTGRAALIRHYTLSPEELEFVRARRGDRNRLGVALQLCLLRHPASACATRRPSRMKCCAISRCSSPFRRGKDLLRVPTHPVYRTSRPPADD